jgi:hypothetical protein
MLAALSYAASKPLPTSGFASAPTDEFKTRNPKTNLPRLGGRALIWTERDHSESDAVAPGF